MADNIAKLVQCGNCGHHNAAESFLKNGWDGKGLYNTGWFQSAFFKARCPICQADYRELDIYPKDNLKISLRKKN